MSRVRIASQPWGVVQDTAGNVRAAQTVTLTTLAGGAVTVYAAETGGTTASPTTNSHGEVAGWIDEDTYLLNTGSGAVQVYAIGTKKLAAGPTLNTATLFQSASGADASLATDFHGLFNFPNVTGISTTDNYADSSTASTTIYQLAGGVYNTGTRPAVGVAGFARGKLVWGSNLVVMADGASSIATGLEIDFQLVTASVGTANGLELHAHGASGNPGHYLGMLSRSGGADHPGPRVGIQIAVSSGEQPLANDGSGTIFETSGAIQATYGLDFHSAAFSGASLWLPVNRGSAGASVGLKLEGRGGFANTGPMIQISSADAATSTYGIRFASNAGANPPVASTGTLFYVDGGSYAKALDISAATFAASGAIAMGDNNISFGTTTGGKIGTGTSQKLAFYNATPIAQYSTTSTSAGFTAGTGTAVLSVSTFTGNTGSAAYTISDVVRALKQLGLMAP